MKTHPTDATVRGVARVHDDELRGLARRPAARALLDDITALPPGPAVRPGRARGYASRRPLIVSAVAATAIVAMGLATLTDRPDDAENPVRLAAAVKITRESNYYE